MTDPKSLRIVYMGTPDFAVAPLRRLVEEGYNIVAVITAPDKPAGRGLRMNECAVKKYAVEAGLRIMQPVKLRDEEFLNELTSLEADLGIVIAFRMLPEVVWSNPRLGTFNLHASLLPEYRGAAPINRAIMNGETMTGVTTFMLNGEIDKGDILGRREVEILDSDTAGTLHDKLMYEGVGLVIDTVKEIASGDIHPLPQLQTTGTLKPAPKIFHEDCRIDWSRPVDQVYNHIRGLSPYPAAWTMLTPHKASETDRYMNAEPGINMKVYSVRKELSGHSYDSGHIVSDGKNVLKVSCPGGFVIIDELQIAGKKRMSAGDFLRGFKNLSDYNLK